MIHDIQHTAISTPDMERALAFYRDLIGFEVESEFELEAHPATDRVLGLSEARCRVVMLVLGASRIELFQYHNPKGRPGDPDRPVSDHGITHLALRVTGIEEEYARLATGGMRFHSPPMRAAGLTATYGRDPDGNVVELLEEHPQTG